MTLRVEPKAVKPARLGRKVLRVAALASSVLFSLAVVGYVFRDRTWWLALLMYLPMALVAPLAIMVQLAALERRWRKWQLGLIAVAVAAGIASISAMCGDEFAEPRDNAMRVVQWNVQWGRDQAGWLETVARIQNARPDIVILSEAPADAKLAELCARLGSEWTFKVSRNAPRSRYWYAIAIASRWPVGEAREVPLPRGAALAADVATRGSALRVLAVDGVSTPWVLRTPLLAAVAKQSDLAPFDIIAGDFNAVSRSVAFDAWETRGFDLASETCRGWRGTYPAFVPLYDIDHVWIGNRYLPVGCLMLDSPGTNHRGQLVYVEPVN